MIKDSMIEEIQELKLAGYTVGEAYDTLKTRHSKVPTLKTVRKYYNMDHVPEDNHAKVRKHAAFDVEPLASAIVEIVERNPGCYMSSVYDVLVERFVESGEMEALPGNEQTLRNYIRRLHEEGRISEPEAARRKYDVLDIPEPGRMAQVDFGQQDCGGGLVVHFMCVLLWHSRLLGVYAQDHRFNSEEACRALHRFSCKCGGRVRTYVIDQDSVFVSEEVYGEVFETATFRAFLDEQDITLWVCRKADPESKGAVENLCVKEHRRSSYTLPTKRPIAGGGRSFATPGLAARGLPLPRAHRDGIIANICSGYKCSVQESPWSADSLLTSCYTQYTYTSSPIDPKKSPAGGPLAGPWDKSDDGTGRDTITACQLLRPPGM